MVHVARAAGLSWLKSEKKNSTAVRMLIVLWCLFPCAFLPLCSGQIISCTVTPYSQYSDQTIYSISNVSHVSDVQAHNCVYSWSNETVLANHKQTDPELVVRNSINELITSKCFDRINFTRHCGFEVEGYMAYCTTNCTLNALSRSEKQEEIVAIAASVVVLVLLALCWCPVQIEGQNFQL